MTKIQNQTKTNFSLRDDLAKSTTTQNNGENPMSLIQALLMNNICWKHCFRVFSSDGCSEDMAFLLQLSSDLTRKSTKEKLLLKWNSTRHQNSKQKL
ncbi:hypothetical protein CARUB_v10018704mg [Capsella rubella]|uniref:Uncharacterized protein n=1 Tax=Capsella rubella TaxID=81985 RepID=R0HN76_9BRAS|nr:hypothetical protein CARUB_v10018704mg [Capsella rubella]